MIAIQNKILSFRSVLLMVYTTDRRIKELHKIEPTWDPEYINKVSDDISLIKRCYAKSFLHSVIFFIVLLSLLVFSGKINNSVNHVIRFFGSFFGLCCVFFQWYIPKYYIDNNPGINIYKLSQKTLFLLGTGLILLSIFFKL